MTNATASGSVSVTVGQFKVTETNNGASMCGTIKLTSNNATKTFWYETTDGGTWTHDTTPGDTVTLFTTVTGNNEFQAGLDDGSAAITGTVGMFNSTSAAVGCVVVGNASPF